MKLVVLGSGTCVPSGARVSSGYWVEAGPARVRLDCGAGTVHAMARWGLPWTSLTHQVITHFHLDHVGELPFLLFSFRYGREAPRVEPLTLVGPRGLGTLIGALERALDQKLLEQEFPVELVELAPGNALTLVGGALLRVAKTPHTAESLCVRIDHGTRAIGYTGDTAPSDALAAFFQGVDVLVAECSFLDESRRTPHLTADDASALAKAAGARKLVATHCYFDPHKARLQERLRAGFSGEVTIAVDGLTLEI